MTADLRTLSDQELADHTLSLHGQLEAVRLETERRWKVAQADRAARGVAWCEESEHEVAPGDLVANPDMAICRPCYDVAVARHEAATYRHTINCPGGKDAAGGECNWEGKGTETIVDEDGVICPRCDRSLEELRDLDAAEADGPNEYGRLDRMSAGYERDPDELGGETTAARELAEQVAANLTAATGVPHRVWEPPAHLREEREIVRASREAAALRAAAELDDLVDVGAVPTESEPGELGGEG